MLNSNKVGLVVGAVIGGWHLVWSLFVVAGWAQRMIDFIFWAHMIQPVYVIKPFDPVAAVTLVVITAASGYVFAYAGATVWNRLHRT